MRAQIDADPLAIVELPRPDLDDLPYRDLIRQLVAKKGFRLDFNRLEPHAAVTLVADQLLGPGTMLRERELLADDIRALSQLMSGLTGARTAVAVRTYFMPGDLVWHVDRVSERHAFRLVWPIGRPAGMRVTPASNIEPATYRMFMQREFPLLCRLDTRVTRTGEPIERLWSHRPAELEAMKSGKYPFVRDPHLEQEVTPGAASIHRIQTVGHPGTFHRSSWANRSSPGFQIIMTSATDAQ